MTLKLRRCKSRQPTLWRGTSDVCTALVLTGLALILLAMSKSMTYDRSLNHAPQHDPSTVERNSRDFSTWNTIIRRSCHRLARAKTQMDLLSNHFEKDLFSSIRPRIGKTFNSQTLEDKKQNILDQCRLQLMELGKEEAIANLRSTQEDHSKLVQEAQNLPAEQYMDLMNHSYSYEKKLLQEFSKKHQKKVDTHVMRREKLAPPPVPPPDLKPEKKKKHHRTLKVRRKDRGRKRKDDEKDRKDREAKVRVSTIKESNLVHNFSTQEVPDEAYLYLALGSTFSTVRDVSQHDHVFDTKLFAKKFAWSAFHHLQGNERDDTAPPLDSARPPDEFQRWTEPSSMKPAASGHPIEQNRRVANLMTDLQNVVEQKQKQKRKSNLTHRERKGFAWCKKMVRERKIYISRADKGGSIYLFDTNTVDDIISETLENPAKFEELQQDPRKNIRQDLNTLLEEKVKDNTILTQEHLLITGRTEKSGQSHSHDFVVNKPHTYPLFKGHKLSKEDFENKKIPPTRMVTASIGGPTYRLGIFLNHVLAPVSLKYCEGELVQDTTHFLQEIRNLNEQGAFSNPSTRIGTLDVDALYPNISRPLAMEALKDALTTCTDYPEEVIATLLDLIKFCLENSVVHYRGRWFKSLDGVPTGGPESGSIANIFVKWMLDKRLLQDPSITRLDRMMSRKRFLDDLWFIWRSTERAFENFKTALNNMGIQSCFTLKGEVGTTVEFLDVKMELIGGRAETSLFIKPTDSDSEQYLNRRSDHSTHVFSGIPYSQFNSEEQLPYALGKMTVQLPSTTYMRNSRTVAIALKSWTSAKTEPSNLTERRS